ncbi:MAG: hypothetical protein JWM05_1702 [Acidimicrobiales bacterium]|nr:hypothetical protein [Acidimicrobiales bacterium]
MMTKRTFAFVAVALLAVAAPACSKKDKAVAKTDYVKQVNAICVKGKKASDDIGKSIDTNNDAQVKKAIKERLVPLRRQEIKDIRGVGYPKGDKPTLDKLYSGAEAELDVWEKDPAKAFDSSRMKTINRDLKAYGLDKCA